MNDINQSILNRNLVKYKSTKSSKYVLCFLPTLVAFMDSKQGPLNMFVTRILLKT